ncbi:hypothetical protein BN341_6520 [Helicobacter heilmannii ASB1.4]|nr:hypothetical protein BN341_6520 [Helicobacter heilmannii ASB1.4]
MLPSPPMPDAELMPMRSAHSGGHLPSCKIWLSKTASLAANKASCMKRPAFLTSFKFITKAGSKSVISAAIRTGKPVASKLVISFTPHSPLTMALKASFLFSPRALTIPMPVTTTLRKGTPHLKGTRIKRVYCLE